MSNIGKTSSKTKTYYALHILQRWADGFRWTTDDCPLDHLPTLEAAMKKGEHLQKTYPTRMLAWCVVKEVGTMTVRRRVVSGMTRKKDRDRALSNSTKVYQQLRQREQDRLRLKDYRSFTPDI